MYIHLEMDWLANQVHFPRLSKALEDSVMEEGCTSLKREAVICFIEVDE